MDFSNGNGEGGRLVVGGGDFKVETASDIIMDYGDDVDGGRAGEGTVMK